VNPCLTIVLRVTANLKCALSIYFWGFVFLFFLNAKFYAAGKYLGEGRGRFILGSDRSTALAQICRAGGHEVSVCDNLILPFRDATFDAALSIAVLHHISTPERRMRALSELARYVPKAGCGAFLSSAFQTSLNLSFCLFFQFCKRACA
jgi:hypothetical protein